MSQNRMSIKCTICNESIVIAKVWETPGSWRLHMDSSAPAVINAKDCDDFDKLYEKIERAGNDIIYNEKRINDFFKKHMHQDDDNFSYLYGGTHFKLEFETVLENAGE